MGPVQPLTPHRTPFLRVLALLAFALVITVLSSLGTYYFLNKRFQAQLQSYQQIQPTMMAPTDTPPLVPTVINNTFELTTITNLVKDFYSKWIPSFVNPSGYPGDPSTKSERLSTEGFLTLKAVDSIKQAQAYDLVTCSQNPLKPEDYTYSSPNVHGDRASMTVSGYYSGDKSTLNITVDLLRSGTKWRIDDFHCPPPNK
jgi:hypothetical protein